MPLFWVTPLGLIALRNFGSRLRTFNFWCQGNFFLLFFSPSQPWHYHSCLDLMLLVFHIHVLLQIFLPSRLDILLPFLEKKDHVWLGLFGQVSLLENSSYNNCCSELYPFIYCSHNFGSGVDPISILLSCAFMYLNIVLSPVGWRDGLRGSFTTSLHTGVGWHQSCIVCNKFSRSLQ